MKNQSSLLRLCETATGLNADMEKLVKDNDEFEIKFSEWKQTIDLISETPSQTMSELAAKIGLAAYDNFQIDTIMDSIAAAAKRLAVLHA